MRIAISGTYGTGKSTLARALAERTGIPLVGARGMRDFLADHFAGKALTECSPAELIELGLRRFEERVTTEAAAGQAFISDGSTLNEWAYGLARRKFGIHPSDGAIRDAPAEQQAMFDEVISHMGRVFRDHASRGYDVVIHLPIAFPMVSDGHRPVSKDYRDFSNSLLETAAKDLNLRMIPLDGCLTTRTERVISTLKLHPSEGPEHVHHS